MVGANNAGVTVCRHCRGRWTTWLAVSGGGRVGVGNEVDIRCQSCNIVSSWSCPVPLQDRSTFPGKGVYILSGNDRYLPGGHAEFPFKPPVAPTGKSQATAFPAADGSLLPVKFLTLISALVPSRVFCAVITNHTCTIRQSM
jgi:hypothetical protein